jgi:hypothetical protein
MRMTTWNLMIPMSKCTEYDCKDIVKEETKNSFSNIFFSCLSVVIYVYFATHY